MFLSRYEPSICPVRLMKTEKTLRKSIPRLRIEPSTSRIQVYSVVAITSWSVVGTPAVMRIFKPDTTQIQDLTQQQVRPAQMCLDLYSVVNRFVFLDPRRYQIF
jgi:hypothetical protein